jgi:hypothetical protein
MKKRVTKTAVAGGVGFLGGLLLEQGLESLTGLDFVDGVFAIGGSVLAAMHVNRDLVEVAAENIKAMFGKDPLEITEDEWKQYKAKYPKSAVYLEKALGV